ncbi:MAG: twin-arginine translocase subunit TatC [Armatimonadota bacterium]
MVANDEKRAELVEHLAELRARIIRSILYICVGAIVAWVSFDSWLFPLLTRPMMPVLHKMGSKFLLTNFPEGFLIRMQICLVAGLILALPLVMWEVWAFVAPGLTPSEKRPVKWVAPLAIVLFLSGVVLCYFILPAAFSWFALYVPKNAELRPSVQQSILFTVKMLFAFGVAFELPIVLMVLGKLGVINSRMLKANWRICVVAVSIVAAVATPSNDAFTMLCMAIPLVFLFLFSIFLVWLVEEDRPSVWKSIAESIVAVLRPGRRNS